MRILFTALVCAFVITTNASESNFTSLDGKTPEGEAFHKKLRSAVSLTCLIVIECAYRAMGIFISPIYVLTAAKPFFVYNITQNLLAQRKIETEQVVVGLDQSSPKIMHLFYVENIHTHDDYVLWRNVKNIAILTIELDYKYSPVGPFPELPRSEQLPNVIHVMTFFNGSLMYNHIYNPAIERIIKTMTVAICKKEVCKETSAFQYHMFDEHICGSTVEDFADMDTIGSPLLAGNVVVGTHVYGTLDTVHIFTDVYKERKFIENATKDPIRMELWRLKKNIM